MTQPVIIQWSISSFFGWGVYGLNLALHWANDPTIEPVCVAPLDPAQINIDPLRERAILPFLIRSLQFQAQISRHANATATADAPLLLALGNGFAAHRPSTTSSSRGPRRSALSSSKRLSMPKRSGAASSSP